MDTVSTHETLAVEFFDARKALVSALNGQIRQLKDEYNARIEAVRAPLAVRKFYRAAKDGEKLIAAAEAMGVSPDGPHSALIQALVSAAQKTVEEAQFIALQEEEIVAEGRAKIAALQAVLDSLGLSEEEHRPEPTRPAQNSGKNSPARRGVKNFTRPDRPPSQRRQVAQAILGEPSEADRAVLASTIVQ